MRYLILFVSFVTIQYICGVLVGAILLQSLPSIKNWKSFDEKEFFKAMDQ